MQDAMKNVNSLETKRLVDDAPAMIGRIIHHMQAALAQDANLPNIPYCALLVKLSASDIAREFVEAFNEGLTCLAEKPPSLSSMFTLELSIADASDPTVEALRQSSQWFETLCANAKTRGVKGIHMFGKDVFLTPLREALVKARIDEINVGHLMPYACRALDVELVALYQQTNSQISLAACRT